MLTLEDKPVESAARKRDPAPEIRRPRVMHLVPALFGEEGVLGGAERYVLELARHMAESTPTTLVTFGDRAEERTVGQLRIRVLGRPWHVRGQRFNPFHLSVFSLAASADVVHCHQTHLLVSSLTALFCRLTRRRVFTTELGGGGWDVSAYLNTDRWFHGHLHISEYSRGVFGHANKSWASVILGGVDPERFRPANRVRRDPTVVFVGRLMPHKGVDDLIRALPDGLTLELLGRPYHPQFLADLQHLARGKSVRFRHECDDADLVDSYQRALCVVLPSVYRDCYGGESPVPELLGQTLLEGMACGTPGLCTRVASLPEVVVDGVTGFVVPPDDPHALGQKLTWLRDHPEEADRMGQAGRELVLDKFTWPAVVRRCLDCYSR